ncbi:hypothetical protein DL95DRAFT_52669 [Leptodontidium sp. 2 PMI_412]|nr:hypothetical protein DL95DRAFT_52669 [Leptodontidium sp. 2 PMI_412]
MDMVEFRNAQNKIESPQLPFSFSRIPLNTSFKLCYFEHTSLLHSTSFVFAPLTPFMKLLIFASLLCVDSATRDKLLGLMTGVSHNAFANEPGVLKFGFFVPSEEPNDKLLYSIEEYANQVAFNSHLTSTPVVEMFSWINSVNIYSRSAEFYSLDSSPDTVSIRPELATVKDPMSWSAERFIKMQSEHRLSRRGRMSSRR